MVGENEMAKMKRLDLESIKLIAIPDATGGCNRSKLRSHRLWSLNKN